MAWSSPMTAVANAVFTAAQFNTFVRDNLNETAPAKATSASGFIVTSGLNSVVQRTPVSQYIGALETTASTTYTSLATSGPAVTVTTGVAAIVIVGGFVSNSIAGKLGCMSYTISGASTVGASDIRALRTVVGAAAAAIDGSKLIYHAGLTPGSNVFTAQYRVDAGTGTWQDRRIDVIPL